MTDNEQEKTMNDHTPITDVMNIGVPVTDQDRALAFYTEKLGFETRRAWCPPARSGVRSR